MRFACEFGQKSERCRRGRVDVDDTRDEDDDEELGDSDEQDEDNRSAGNVIFADETFRGLESAGDFRFPFQRFLRSSANDR